MKILIPTALRIHTNNQALLEVSLSPNENYTVRDVLDLLYADYKAFIDKLFKEGKINRFIIIYVDCEDIRFLEELETKVTDKNELMFDLAISGG